MRTRGLNSLSPQCEVGVASHAPPAKSAGKVTESWRDLAACHQIMTHPGKNAHFNNLMIVFSILGSIRAESELFTWQPDTSNNNHALGFLLLDSRIMKLCRLLLAKTSSSTLRRLEFRARTPEPLI